MEEKFCQSCAMPLGTEGEMCGTNADGSKNADYCLYCYKEGDFTDGGVSMEAFVEACIPHLRSVDSILSEEAARQKMLVIFPELKRWKKTQ